MEGLQLLGLGALVNDLLLLGCLHEKSIASFELNNFNFEDLEVYGLTELMFQDITQIELPF
jgi:hypothetical protein